MLRSLWRWELRTLTRMTNRNNMPLDIKILDIKIGDVVCIAWVNSWRWNTLTKAELEKIEEKSFVQTTTGKIVKILDGSCFIAQSETELAFDNVLQIPKNSVKDILFLK